MDRSEKALEYFDNKFNCAQSVLAVFAIEQGLTEDEALRISCAFGGGIGRQQLTCGAVIGASMALGLLFGKGKSDSDDKKMLTYEHTVEFFDEFKKLNNSVECRKLLNDLDMTDEKDHRLIMEQNLFQTSCRKYVSDAVRIAEKIIEKYK